MTPTTLAATLTIHPFPGATFELTPPCCRIAIGVTYLRYDGAWNSGGRSIPCEIPEGTVTGEIVHAEIRRVLAVLADPSPTWEEIKAGCVGPDLPSDLPPTTRTCDESGLLAPTPADAKRRLYNSGGVRVLAEPFDYGEYRAKDLWATRIPPDQETVIANEAVLGDIAALMGMEPTGIAWRSDLTQSIKRLVDAHAVVSQRLAGAQREVAEVSTERDDAQAQVDRLTSQHDDWQADIDRARRDTYEATARANKVEDRRRRDDELREQIADAVGLDGSASLALILDTVKSADTTKDTDLARLISYHQAPITFNARPLTLAERASFVIRRLWQGRTNAANEAAALRRELGDIADALGDLPDTAEREPIGDREEHLGLSTAERIRLSR